MTPMSWIFELKKYEELAHSVEPAATLLTRDNWFIKTLWWLLAVFTFGIYAKKVPLQSWIDDFALAIGPFQFYSVKLQALCPRRVVHECRHTTQDAFLGWFFPILGWFFGRRVRAVAGIPFKLVIYVFLFFPVMLAYPRYWFELDAHRASWKWMLGNGYTRDEVSVAAESQAESVLGSSYVYPWPAPLVRRGFKKARDKVLG